uniref:Carboxylic ester hydrolase n=1 Tax=Cyrtorhinus lividipennis TaxID=1032904 RepID=A0A808J6J1_9HEMI|nr:juvenile hormone esterase [Cyrtorhinus lividipennis]
MGMLIIVFAVGVFAGAVQAEQPEATTTLGVLKGLNMETISGRKFYGFQGVPYARPPIGKHRFKQSIPGTPWPGVLNATRLPNMCMQLKTEMFYKDSPFDVLGSEDCLYLNIYTPKLPSELPDGKLLDVVFYIHGGAFQLMSGDFWGPKYILDRDVVYVNFNYRLGLLGFLSLEDKSCPGNNGLKDQNLALRWVNKHIAAFGGNPNSITIAGLSAGGASVHFQLLSPLSKGLFQKAISASGVVNNPWALTENPRAKALVVAESVGCPTTDSILILECLRERTAEQLVISVKNLAIWQNLPIASMGPVIEPTSATAFLDQPPNDVIQSKTFNDVPVIFSHTNDEGAFFANHLVGDPAAAQQLETDWDKFAPIVYEMYDTVDSTNAQELLQLIRNEYLKGKNITEGLVDFVRSVSDRWFLNGIREVAILHAQHQASPVYAYRFSYPGDDSFNMKALLKDVPDGGAPHGFDHSFLFNSPLSPDIHNFPEPLKMSQTMLDYYTDFITQTPVPSWETVKSGLPNFKFLDIVGPDPTKNAFKTEEPLALKFWNSLKLQENAQAAINPTTHNEL